jgi:hypothetical protein
MTYDEIKHFRGLSAPQYGSQAGVRQQQCAIIPILRIHIDIEQSDKGGSFRKLDEAGYVHQNQTAETLYSDC